MADSVVIKFKVQYDGSLLDNQKFEYAPVLMFWSSMKGRKKHFTSLAWADEARTLSHWTDAQIVLPAIPGETYDAKTNRFLVRPDDTLGVQAKVTTPNEEGETTLQAVGDGLLPFALELVKKDALPLESWEHNIDLTFSMYFDKKGHHVKKGAVAFKEFSAVLKSTGRAVSVGVNPALKLDEFSYVAANEVLFSSVVRDMMVRSITPFTQEAVEKCMAFLPASEEVKRVHAPFYHLPAGLAPGMNFLMSPGATKIADSMRRDRSEAWLRKIIGYSLARDNMREDFFIQTVEQQHARTDNTYDDAYTQCAAIVGQALAIPATSMPYIGDFVRTGSRKKATLDSKLSAQKNGFVAFSNKHMHSVERFSHMEQNDGGDCEDGGCFACRIGNTLAENEWRDPLVRTAGALMKQYVLSLNLGSVRAASLGNDKSDKKMKDGTIIDTTEDRSVSVGAHMWAEAIPLAKFVALVQRSVSDLNPDLLWLPGASRAPWAAALPHMVIEATGRLTPLVLPASEYVVTGGEKAKAALVERIKMERTVDRYIDSNTVTFKQMKTVRQQEMLTLEPDKRLTNFYRDTTHTFTTSFYKMGLSNIDWIWANRGARISARDAWKNADKFQLNQLSSRMRAPSDGATLLTTATTSATTAAAAPAAMMSIPKSSLIPVTSLNELNAVTALVGNKTPLSSSVPSFAYGVPIEDKLQCPLLPATSLVPGAALSQREVHITATLLRHSPPIDVPGDWDQINEMHEARRESLFNEGIDESARERFEDDQVQKLIAGIRKVTGRTEDVDWPSKPSSRWVLKKDMFSTRMFPEDQGDKVVNTITADVKKMVDLGVVKYARVFVEEPMPHRRNVVIQLLCNPTKITE